MKYLPSTKVRFIHPPGFEGGMTVALRNNGAGFQPSFHFGVGFPVRCTGLVWDRAVGAGQTRKV